MPNDCLEPCTPNGVKSRHLANNQCFKYFDIINQCREGVTGNLQSFFCIRNNISNNSLCENYIYLSLFLIFLLVYKDGTSICGQFSVDECIVPEAKYLIDSNRDNSEVHCQATCQQFKECRFYMYDRAQTMCRLYSSDLSSYIKTCDKTTGPKDVAFKKCFSSRVTCNVSVYIACI